MMSEYEWAEEMGEISGFGGAYENACRNMVIAGARWLNEHPDADPDFGEMEGVFGVSESFNDDAERLRDKMVGATDGTPTGAMVHACTRHVVFIQENGWDEYVRMMEASE